MTSDSVEHSPRSTGDAPVIRIAVFDIDGVLADVRHRLHHVERSPKNWDGFFAEMVDDAPLEPPLDLAPSRVTLVVGIVLATLIARELIEDGKATWFEGCLLLGIVGTAFGAAGDAYLGDLASASLSADNFGVYQGTVSALQTGCRDLPWYCMQSAARRAPLPLEG